MGVSAAFQEIRLKPTDLASIGSTWRGPVGEFSVLDTPEKIDQIDFENPALFDADGKLHGHLAEKIGVLANPRALAGLMSLSGQNIIDMVVCHGSDGQKIALTSADKSLWMQFPAPIVPVVELIEKDLLAPEGDLPKFEWTLSETQAFVFWGMIDLLHQREDSDWGKRFAAQELLETFTRPARMAELLAPYYRDCLRIPLPSLQAVQGACDEMAARELFGKIGRDFLAGELVIGIARALNVVTWHSVLKASVHLDGGQPAGMQVWLLQGVSGLGLMWCVVNGSVSIMSLSKEQIADTIGQTLSDPAVFFTGASAPAVSASARVPVPAAVPSPAPAAASAAPAPQPKPKRTKWVIGCFVAAAALLGLCLLALGVLGLMAAYPDLFFGP